MLSTLHVPLLAPKALPFKTQSESTLTYCSSLPGSRGWAVFVSAAVYENDHVVLEISIDKKTGQVVDARSTRRELIRALLFLVPAAGIRHPIPAPQRYV